MNFSFRKVCTKLHKAYYNAKVSTELTSKITTALVQHFRKFLFVCPQNQKGRSDINSLQCLTWTDLDIEMYFIIQMKTEIRLHVVS